MKNVLVVDNDPIMLHTFVGLLKSQGSFLQILSAANVQTALEVLSGEDVHILITGMHMSEMDAFELLSLLGAKYPQTRVIVMTNNASSMLRTKIKQMASVIHFDQALDISMLTKRIFTELQIDYGGQVRGITLSSFLQMLELERRSCTLQVTAKGKTGTIFILDGKPAAARMGLLTGKSAALHILTWENVLIDIDYAPREVQREIATPLMNLLLESGRIVDEKQSQRPNQRKHSRYDCLVGVDYDISDWTYQCYMRDISEGGAYIETEQPIKVGQRLTMSLASPVLERTCAINGTVVRRDPKGIGVRFDNMTLQQKQVIRSLTETRCSPIAGSSQ
ncbi:PilZ domain-containing protein [uncultured Desulfosarcina sp.]|uniref:PilZ domain-containing protein n=1 Tax=uncultured Desulfosarcina sp. TaxID=218289 RepID=UPI0029C78136|nr:PilZ domain-containing protein [uncultured Desulfosarcina sp.]